MAAGAALIAATALTVGLVVTSRSDGGGRLDSHAVATAMAQVGMTHIQVESLGSGDGCSALGLCPDGVDPSSVQTVVTSAPPSTRGSGITADIYGSAGDAAYAAEQMRNAPGHGSMLIAQRRNIVLYASPVQRRRLASVVALLR